MAKLGISTGSSPNDGTGDSLIDGAIKINSNFAEIYTTIGDGSTLAVPVTSIAAGSNISVSGATGNVTITNTGVGNTNNLRTDFLEVSGISTLTGTLNANGGVVGNVTGSSSQVTVSDESSDTTCFPLFTNEATGNLEPKSGNNLTFNSSSGALTATSFSGSGTDISGIVTSITAGNNINVSGSTGNITITGLANTANVTTDSLVVSGIATFNNFLRLPSGTFDNNSIQLGNNQDFTLQYNSASTQGILRVLNNPLGIYGSILTLAGGSNSTKIEIDDSVELYYGSSLKIFETTGVGVTVFGTTQTQQLNVSGFSTFTGVSTFNGATNFNNDVVINGGFDLDMAGGGDLDLTEGGVLKMGAGGVTNLEIYNNGSVSVISDSDTTGVYGLLLISPTGIELQKSGTGNEKLATFTPDGSVDLYYNDSKKFETTGVGVTVFGTTQTQQLNVSGFSTFTGVSTFNGATNFNNDITVTGNTNTSGIVTGATYYGDASYITSGRWVLGANGSTDYTFTGPGFDGATNDPILYLARGRVYEFVNTMNDHPFQIRVSNGGADYSNGVTNNGTSNGTVRFEIPMDAPNTLYYQCTSHPGMGNTISVYPNTI